MLCMMCGNEATDAYEYTPPGESILNERGPYWVYCLKCDCWTEYPEEAREEVGE